MAAPCLDGARCRVCVDPAWHLLVHVALGAGREVRLHHRLELCLVAAVFENRVVMVTAEGEGFVVREPGTVEAKVVVAFVVRVRLTDPEMRGQDWKTESPGSVGSLAKPRAPGVGPDGSVPGSWLPHLSPGGRASLTCQEGPSGLPTPPFDDSPAHTVSRRPEAPAGGAVSAASCRSSAAALYTAGTQLGNIN